MSTFTASQHQSEPRTVHAGQQSVSSRLDVAGTGTASSVALLVKVPNGAVIDDFIWYAADAGGDNTWKVGVQYPTDKATSESALMAETANSGGVNFRGSNAKLPFTVSFTSNTGETYAWVIATCTAALSGSALQKMTLFYHMK